MSLRNKGIICFYACFVILSISSCHVHRKSGLAPKDLTLGSNIALRNELKKWIGVPYSYGGNDKQGVDCSGFVHQIFETVYHKSVPRTVKLLYADCTKIKVKEAREGDLVFFKTIGNEISHVGILIEQNTFIHASTSKGVIESKLDNPYYKSRFVGFGRIQ